MTKSGKIENHAEVVQINYPLSAFQYLQNRKDINIVIYVADRNLDVATQDINFYTENFKKMDRIFLVLVHHKKQISELFMKGVDDVFYVNSEIQSIFERATILLTYQNQVSICVSIDKAKIKQAPLWEQAKAFTV